VENLLATLEKQSGNRIVFADRALKRPLVTIAAREAPFWLAFDEVLDEAGLAVTAPPEGKRDGPALFVTNRGERDRDRAGRAAYKGPFRIEAKSVAAKREDGDATGDGLRATIEVAWEPRITPIALTLAARDLAAADDRGQKISAATPTASWSTTSVAGSTSVTFDVPLTPASGDATKLVALTGRLSVLLPGNEMAFRFDKLADVKKPLSQQRADATVRLESFRRQDDTWQARLRVVYNDPQDSVQSHHGWLYEKRAKLIAPDRKEITPSRVEASGAEDGVQALYTFTAPAKIDGYTLVYTTPAVIMTMPVEFKLADLPLR
jgi:hypothetical protein